MRASLLALCGLVLLAVGIATLVAADPGSVTGPGRYLTGSTGPGPTQVIVLGAAVLLLAAGAGRRPA